MNKHKFLYPIDSQLPPPCHTQVNIRCFTCKKWAVCNIREDYLKTATLIQNILGDPCEKVCLCDYPYKNIPNFVGIDFVEPELYFPETITTTTSKTGTFVAAKYKNINEVLTLYKFGEYLVVFPATFEKEKESYEVKVGFDAYYYVKYEMKEENRNSIETNLLSWREKQSTEEKDIINTTAFSCRLECRHYEYEKGLTYEQGIKRMFAQYPEGVPMKDGQYYHLATFHYEDEKVSLYRPTLRPPTFAPMPYPVINACCCPKAPTRDEVNETQGF